jgi:hypothetical protein
VTDQADVSEGEVQVHDSCVGVLCWSRELVVVEQEVPLQAVSPRAVPWGFRSLGRCPSARICNSDGPTQLRVLHSFNLGPSAMPVTMPTELSQLPIFCSLFP